MSDLPPGQWTELLLGDHWPDAASLQTLSSASTERHSASTQFERYADTLRAIYGQNLVRQEGYTAEDTRNRFIAGEHHAREVTRTSRVKSQAYKDAHRSMEQLRQQLNELAAEGNQTIDAVIDSEMSLPDKVSRISAIIAATRSNAAIASAVQAGEIYSAIQTVLSNQGIDISARTFSAANGVATPTPNRLETSQIEKHVAKYLENRTSAPSNALSAASAPGAQGCSAAPVNGTTSSGGTPTFTGTAVPESPQSDNFGSPERLPNEHVPANATTSFGTSTKSDPARTISATPALTARSDGLVADPLLSSSDSAAILATHSIDSPGAPVSPPGPILDRPHFGSPTEHIAESFNAGNRASAPTATSTEAISTLAESQIHNDPARPLGLPFTEPVHHATPSLETAHANLTHSPIESPQTTTFQGEFTQPVAVSTPPPPITTAVPPLASGTAAMAVPTTTPPSGLLAYGADLRPASPTPPTGPTPNPTAPSSAPLNPGSVSSSTAQPTVLRGTPSASAATTASQSTVMTERALAAASLGAATSTTATRSLAEARLRRLLDAVARQQPRLRWGIGDLEDGSTVLVTDLASGWIPPDIAIPTGVRLVPPSARRAGLAALLGQTVLSATYEPGQYIGPHADPPPTSVRARDVAPVEDLGWELSQATRWRDGLPRLAHTLSKALSAGTGYLDSEVAMLHEHLATSGNSILDGYLLSVIPTEIGNWQLLATIAALINDEKTAANYHFAWFRAQAPTREGKR